MSRLLPNRTIARGRRIYGTDFWLLGLLGLLGLFIRGHPLYPRVGGVWKEGGELVPVPDLAFGVGPFRHYKFIIPGHPTHV